ncbi:MAG TPA: MbtH family protein [Actinomycetales bacterium]|nr:MbtH family protein [Actinomycetales bacterium]
MTLTHPFENDATEYVVLTNDRSQYSLWPASIRIPSGWLAVNGPASRQECLDYVNGHWQDLRPSVPGQRRRTDEGEQ